MDAETAPAEPAFWRVRTFNLAEIEEWSQVSYAALYQWCALSWAAGVDLGEKQAGRWLFNCQDLYYLALLLAISDTGVGIGAAQIRAASSFATTGKPTGPFILMGPSGASATFVRAPEIWQAVERNWRSCELAAEENAA